jgi:hypothetical protein
VWVNKRLLLQKNSKQPKNLQSRRNGEINITINITVNININIYLFCVKHNGVSTIGHCLNNFSRKANELERKTPKMGENGPN